MGCEQQNGQQNDLILKDLCGDCVVLEGRLAEDLGFDGLPILRISENDQLYRLGHLLVRNQQGSELVISGGGGMVYVRDRRTTAWDLQYATTTVEGNKLSLDARAKLPDSNRGASHSNDFLIWLQAQALSLHARILHSI